MSDLGAARDDLKQRAIRGGLAKLCAQIGSILLRLSSLMLLARLLTPEDFGLIAMVTAVIGVLNLFRDLGLSTATIQQASISQAQLSTLFWLNVLVGLALTCVAVASAPALASFYSEPRLLWVVPVLASSFVANAVGIQHSALLQRQMRFTVVAVIDIVSLLVSVAVGVGMAIRGAGYWSLVGMTLAAPVTYSAAVWMASGWMPGRPQRDAGVVSMMRIGGLVTANGLVVYAAYNIEKVLLGRFWGAEALGIYGRAYQLINIPTDNLNSAVGTVALSTLSRVRDDPVRLRSYFLKGYALLIAATLPITAACAIFSDDIVLLTLGPRWTDAASIFRLLAPTVLVFGMINPTWPLLVAQGMLVRSFHLALVIAPLAIVAYVIGLPWGPKGVAMAFSIAMSLWVVPHLAWCLHGTVVSLKDIAVTIARPLASTLAAAAASGGVAFGLLASVAPWLRLAAGLMLLGTVYLGLLLFAMGQRTLYLEVLRGLRTPATP
jgi:PST family polysaccharide transporter